MTIYKQWEMTSVLLYKETNFKFTISSYSMNCLSERKSVNLSRLGEL